MTGDAPPLVSVVIPAFNAAATIGETLASACAQTHRALEIIVVDDGSSDGTAAAVEAIARDEPRIRLVTQPNGGVARARNAALALARGSFVAPLDADDLWHPTKIARQLARFAAEPAAHLVYCWSVDIDEAGLVTERRLDVVRYEGDVIVPLIRTNFIDSSSVPLIRREALVQAGGWCAEMRDRNAQGCEDWLLYLRIAERGRFALEPAFLVGYRQSVAAMSRNTGAMRRSMEIVLAEARQRHPALPRALFRWARAGFDHYAADLVVADGAGLRSKLLRARAVARDPGWLTSRTARRKAKTWLRGAGALPPGSPRGVPYSELPPEPDLYFARDAWEARRDARLATFTAWRGRD